MLYIRLIGRQIKIIGSHVVTIIRILWIYARSHRIIASAIVLALVVSIGALLYFFGSTAPDPTLNDSRAVTLIRVGDVSATAPLSLVGTVRPTREAHITPSIPGTVTAIYRNLGDYVAAGTIIAEIKNDTQRASVAQARAAVQKTQSAVAIGGLSVENAESSYAAAIDGARATVQTAYATIDDAIARKTDQVFSNPNGPQPHFNVSSANSQLMNTVQADRLAMQPIRARHQKMNVVALNVDMIIHELATLSAEAKEVQRFMQNLVQALNGAIPANSITDDAIATFRFDASNGLTAINGLASSLPGSIELLKAKRAAVAIAQTSLATGDSGISADVTGAEANLAAALAGLENTLIRAPISGTINSLNLDVGSFVSAAAPVIYITSAGGLEVILYVSGADLRDVAIGARARVGASVMGTVVRVATALDPTTKKAEVRIAVPPSAPFVGGQSATISIDRTTPRTLAAAAITVPLTAIKITPETTLVFTVNDTSELVANPVTIGRLHGTHIAIQEGLTLDMMIVKDARGLKEGQRIIVEP